MESKENHESPKFYQDIQSRVVPAVLEQCAVAVGEDCDVCCMEKDSGFKFLIFAKDENGVSRRNPLRGVHIIGAKEEFAEEFPAKKFARPVFTATIFIHNEKTVNIGVIETAKAYQKNGIATAFYDSMKEVANNNAYEYMYGTHHDWDIAETFLRRGRYYEEELPEDLRQRLRLPECKNNDFNTVQILSDSERNECIPERIKNMEIHLRTDRVVFLRSFRQWLDVIRSVSNAAESAQNVHALDQVIETLEVFNEELSDELKLTAPARGDIVTSATQIRVMLKEAELRAESFFQEVTVSYLKDDMEILDEIGNEIASSTDGE